MSAWITVTISLERLLAVAVPMKFKTISTLYRARVLITVICITCVPLTSYPLWTSGSILSPTGVLRCRVPDDNRSSYIKWMTTTNIAGSLFVPSILLIVFTSIFFILLGRSRMKPRQVSKLLFSVAPLVFAVKIVPILESCIKIIRL